MIGGVDPAFAKMLLLLPVLSVDDAPELSVIGPPAPSEVSGCTTRPCLAFARTFSNSEVDR